MIVLKEYAITGELDILVLNASIQYRKVWNEITSEEFDRQIKVNFKGSLELIQRFAPGMQQKSGAES